MVSYTSASFLISILAAAFLLFYGNVMNIKNGEMPLVFLYKVLPIALSFALVLVAFKVI